MSFRDVLRFAAAAALIALAAALHSPFAENLSGVWASMSP
jgi:hypothetical protein